MIYSHSSGEYYLDLGGIKMVENLAGSWFFTLAEELQNVLLERVPSLKSWSLVFTLFSHTFQSYI